MAVGNGTITRASKDSTRSALDFYPTPAIAVHTLLDEELFVGDVWECASGRGDISLALLERGLSVVSSDVQGEDWIFGEKNVDFLQAHRVVTNIITNPPLSAPKPVHSARLEVRHREGRLDGEVGYP